MSLFVPLLEFNLLASVEALVEFLSADSSLFFLHLFDLRAETILTRSSLSVKIHVQILPSNSPMMANLGAVALLRGVARFALAVNNG